MRSQHRVLEALLALAAMSCGDDVMFQGATRDVGRDAGRDAGPRDAGPRDAGGFHDPNEGAVCDAGERYVEDKKLCGEAHMDWLNQCKPRIRTQQCYIASPSETCLPPEDPTVLGRVQDAIIQYGYRTKSVLGEAPGSEIPASCDRVLDCCARLDNDRWQQDCYDRIDDGSLNCELWTPSTYPAEYSRCEQDSDAGTAAPADAGAGRSHRCCYQVCAFFVDT